MTEKSYWWTTGGAGDGASTYTRVDLQHCAAVLASCNHFEGVAPDYLNELEGTVGGANQFDIDTGGAVVDGRQYRNDASKAVTIPSTTSLERIDRIVLRADWTAQTVRITRIAGTESATPSPPSITQTSGTTYDITLYQVRVNSSGTVTVEKDERTWARPAAVAAMYSTNTGQGVLENKHIDFEDEVYDTHNAVTIGASWKFTAPVPGLYRVASLITFRSDATEAWSVGHCNQVRLYHKPSGGSYSLVRLLGQAVAWVNTQMEISAGGSCAILLGESDELYIEVYTGDPVSTHTTTTDGAENWIAIELINPYMSS